MNEEEYFIKTYPDACYGDKPLSPYWDLFQYGVEFGERQSEKKIEELERKLEQTEKDLADYQFNYPTIKEVSKENAELEEKINILENCDRLGDMITEAYKEQLAQAKEIIKSLIALFYNPVVTKDDLKKQDKILEQAEQFLKEIEKCQSQKQH